MPAKNGDEWKELGEDLGRTVQDAISSGNFTHLADDIRVITTKAADTAQKQVQRSLHRDSVTHYSSSAGPKKGPNYSSSASTGPRRTYASNANYTGTAREVSSQPTGTYNARPTYPGAYNYSNAPGGAAQPPALYERTVAPKVLSSIGMGLGYSFGITFVALSATFFGTGHPFLGLLFAPFSLFLVGGICSSVSLARTLRFDKYLKVLKGKSYATIKALAEATGKSEKFVRADVNKWIRKKWFRQGHLDNAGTTLITDDATYRQYLELEENAEREKAEAEEARLRREKEETEKYAGLTEGQRLMIVQGEEYLRQIHECNDAIPGEQISAKITRLEESVERIMQRARKHPRYVGDLRRLMNYYLPTTVKLLGAYADLDREEKSTETIERSKQEIEATIDTLNDAFDKLFDDMFVDTSLDISTDAEVMKTLLEQEGLTGGNDWTDITSPPPGYGETDAAAEPETDPEAND